MTHPAPQVLAPLEPGFERILTDDALAFVADLQRIFGARRRELLAARDAREARLQAGELPGLLPETEAIRANRAWRVADAPADLNDRRVEITGPVDRKMMINALNSGANCFMADLEDSCSPTWQNVVQGQINLADAVRRELEFEHPTTGKRYALGDDVAALLVRRKTL